MQSSKNQNESKRNQSQNKSNFNKSPSPKNNSQNQAERPRQSPQSARKNQRKNKTSKSERGNTVAEVTTAGHSPTSSNGLTIEEFLTRYPEVKRLSSRFGDDETTLPPTKSKKQKQHKSKKSKSVQESSGLQEKQRNAFTAFFSPPTSTPLIRNNPTTTPQPPPPTTKRTAPKITPRQRTTRPPKKKTRPQTVVTTSRPRVVEEEDFNDYEYQSLDYDYYYDQLVPEHERFFQLPKTPESDGSTDGDTGGGGGGKVEEENKAGFAVFTHFSENPSINGNQKSGNSKPRKGGRGKQGKEKKGAKPKVQTSSGFGGAAANEIARPSPKQALAAASGPSAGPFGYTEKGTFFIDSHYNGFPESIDLVYQGFVWAFTMNYPDQPSVLHGGVHTILLDKVKKETIPLAGDYIVRVTGRASPYNINRLTLYTKQGKKYGPWGDRHSEESVDFDVSAPAGHGLAFFSGTIDFGVPLRSVSFHWRPIQ